jgi:HAD superfamily hydrolase (TIGR01509 family)
MKTILIDAVDCFVSDTGVVFQEMYDLLETYPNKKIILTGANDEQFKTFGLAAMPYEVFTLKHNPEKADPRYYELMLEHFGLEKNDVIYFEHNPKAVESAQSIGITSYFYDNDIKDLTDLKKFIDANIN